MAPKTSDEASVTQIEPRSYGFCSVRPEWSPRRVNPLSNEDGRLNAVPAFEAPNDASSISAQPAHLGGEVAEVIGNKVSEGGDAPQLHTHTAPPRAAPSNGQEMAGMPHDRPDNQGEDSAVTVEVLAIPKRGGRRRKEERYPFSTIETARQVGTDLIGESFFIPNRDHPKRQIAVARKRYGREMTFETRAGDGGVRVWRRS